MSKIGSLSLLYPYRTPLQTSQRSVAKKNSEGHEMRAVSSGGEDLSRRRHFPRGGPVYGVLLDSACKDISISPWIAHANAQKRVPAPGWVTQQPSELTLAPVERLRRKHGEMLCERTSDGTSDHDRTGFGGCCQCGVRVGGLEVWGW